jgi:hypothetical protein
MAHTSDKNPSRDENASRQDQGSRGGDDGFAGDTHHLGAEAADAMKDRARGMADEVKSKGSDQLAGVSRAVHDAADRLGREMPQAAGYIHSAADRLDGASTTLRERNIEDLISSFSNFARRQPAAAFVGSVLAGFALSRFLKSSTPAAGREAKST